MPVRAAWVPPVSRSVDGAGRRMVHRPAGPSALGDRQVRVLREELAVGTDRQRSLHGPGGQPVVLERADEGAVDGEGRGGQPAVLVVRERPVLARAVGELVTFNGLEIPGILARAVPGPVGGVDVVADAVAVAVVGVLVGRLDLPADRLPAGLRQARAGIVLGLAVDVVLRVELNPHEDAGRRVIADGPARSFALGRVGQRLHAGGGQGPDRVARERPGRGAGVDTGPVSRAVALNPAAARQRPGGGVAVETVGQPGAGRVLIPRLGRPLSSPEPRDADQPSEAVAFHFRAGGS